MKQIPLTQEKYALVDDEDYQWLMQWKWYCDGRGYAARSGKKDAGQNVVYMHRAIMRTPKGLLCDHANGSTLDNRKSNLRNCTKTENNWNSRKPNKGSSKFKGVHWSKRDKKWIARIRHDGIKKVIGYLIKKSMPLLLTTSG